MPPWAPTALVVRVESGTDIVLTADATGRGARGDTGLAEAVAGAAVDVTPRTVQGWLVGALAREHGGHAEYVEMADGVRMTAALPTPTE